MDHLISRNTFHIGALGGRLAAGDMEAIGAVRPGIGCLVRLTEGKRNFVRKITEEIKYVVPEKGK